MTPHDRAATTSNGDRSKIVQLASYERAKDSETGRRTQLLAKATEYGNAARRNAKAALDIDGSSGFALFALAGRFAGQSRFYACQAAKVAKCAPRP